MATPKLYEVESTTLQQVVSLINYSSVNCFNEDVKKIQEWMKQQPHLPEIMDVKKIQNFLIINKGSVEKAEINIDNYYTIRSKIPDVFDHINPKLPYLENVLAACYFLPLPKRTKDMYRVNLFRTRDKLLMETLDPLDYVRLVINVHEIAMIEDVAYDEVLLVDGKDVPFSFVTKLTPFLLNKALILFIENVFSNRLVEGIYLFNAPPFVDQFLDLLKVVMDPKLLDRIYIFQNSESMIDHFGKEILPRDYGGDEKSIKELQDMVQEKLLQYQEHFDRLDKLRVNENLRPEKLENDEILGLYKNFKNIDID